MEITLEELKKKADSGYTLVEVKFKPDIDFCGTISGHELAECLDANSKATTLYSLTDNSMIILYERREFFEREVHTPIGINPQFFYDEIY